MGFSKDIYNVRNVRRRNVYFISRVPMQKVQVTGGVWPDEERGSWTTGFTCVSHSVESEKKPSSLGRDSKTRM